MGVGAVGGRSGAQLTIVSDENTPAAMMMPFSRFRILPSFWESSEDIPLGREP
jgi:hypothetical protein